MYKPIDICDDDVVNCNVVFEFILYRQDGILYEYIPICKYILYEF